MRLTGSATFTPSDVTGLVSRVATGAQRATKETADSVLQQSQVLVPIRTGALYKSGNVTEEPQPGRAESCVNYDENYAGYVERGTWKMEAQPYLRPAMDSHHSILMDNTVAETKASLS